MKPENFTVPALRGENVPLYTQAIRELMEAYQELSVDYTKVKKTCANWSRECQRRSMHVIKTVS